jgi:putative flavoprotein involved in K+ transport
LESGRSRRLHKLRRLPTFTGTGTKGIAVDPGSPKEVDVDEQVGVVVIGAGQAGLATSHELTQRGVEHLVLERGRIGETWRRRWDSFCLVTPNWSVQLPGHGYDGEDPDGYMPRDEIVAYLERYAATSKAPVREGVEVSSLRRLSGDQGYLLKTTLGRLEAQSVVVATGAYQKPHRPAGASSLPAGLLQIDVEGYRLPESLPQGKVLVVGSGQSGCQLAEELHEAGRKVYLSCGRAPWVPRRLGGRDIVWWLIESGIFDQPFESLQSPTARLISNPLATGHGGGHDLHLRTLHAMGVTLTGHFLGATGREARFAPDLAESLAWGDARHREFVDVFSKLAAQRGLEPPEFDEPGPFDARAPERLDLSGLGAVIFAGGFRPDYRSWLPWAEAFDDLGFPLQRDGASIVLPGLYFAGVHFLRKRKSSLLCGVGEDAQIVASTIADSQRVLSQGRGLRG